jgi:hypothetical protein
MNPDPVIALPAKLDRRIKLHQPIQNIFELVSVQFSEYDEGIVVH